VNHEPECPMTTLDADCCTLSCHCDAIRAAYQRGVDSVTLTVVNDMYKKGYTAALAAAREAVAAANSVDMILNPHGAALAAIATLRGGA